MIKGIRKLYDQLNERIVDRYGLGVVLRQYGFYPKRFPITVTGEHGPSLLSSLISEAFEKPSPFYLYTSSHKSVFDFRKRIQIRHPSPFIWYRRKNGILKNTEAKGSVFFLAHSTGMIKARFDYDKLFAGIKSLPEDFSPITFCLHFNDVNNGVNKYIESQGYHYFSLSENYLDNQIESFYMRIPNFKYALANNFTSGLLYCTEMDIPCSIIFKEDVTYYNYGNPQYKLGLLSGNIGKNPKSFEAHSVFKGIHRRVTETQKQFTSEALSLDLIDSNNNRLKVAYSLYVSLLYCFIALVYKRIKATKFQKIFKKIKYIIK